MKSKIIFQKGGFYYGTAHAINAGKDVVTILPFKVGSLNEKTENFEIGNDIIFLLESFDFGPVSIVAGVQYCDEMARKMGFKSDQEMRRGALAVYFYEKEDGLISVHPTIRRGKRDPAFEFKQSILSVEAIPEVIGRAFRAALRECS